MLIRIAKGFPNKHVAKTHSSEPIWYIQGISMASGIALILLIRLHQAFKAVIFN